MFVNAEHLVLFHLGSTAYTLDGWHVSAHGRGCRDGRRQYNPEPLLEIHSVSRAQPDLHLAFSGNVLRAMKLRSFSQPTSYRRQLPLNGQIFNSVGTSFAPQIAAFDASGQDNFTTTTTDLAATNLQTAVNGSVTTISYTWTPNANLKNGLEIQLLLGGNLNAASGFFDISLVDVRATPGLSTGLNSNPPLAEIRTISAELTECQRFFSKSFPQTTAPVDSISTDLYTIAFFNFRQILERKKSFSDTNQCALRRQ